MATWTTTTVLEFVGLGYSREVRPWPDLYTDGGTGAWTVNSYGEAVPSYPQDVYFALASSVDASTPTFKLRDYFNLSWNPSGVSHQQFIYGFKIAKADEDDPQYYLGVCPWMPFGNLLSWKWAIFDENFNFIHTPNSGNYANNAYYGNNYIAGQALCGLYYDNDLLRIVCPWSSSQDIDTPSNLFQCHNMGISVPAFLARCKADRPTLVWSTTNELVVTGDEVSPEYGNASAPEGYDGGTFDDSSDTISIPTAPALGVSSTGFVNLYNPSAQALQNFGADLFPDLTFTPVSTLPAPSSPTEALENIATVLTTIGNQVPNMIDMFINSQLINYIVDCHIIPVAPTTSGAQSIKVGFKTFSQTAAVVTSDYIDFDCGSLNVGEYYANYIDYAPYTSAKLFLPFVGYVDILPEYWQSGTLSVTYRFNVIDGSFIVFVKSTSSKSNLSDTIIAQYGGNCCVHIPITGVNYSNMVSGIAAGTLGVAMTGNANGGSKLLETASGVAAMRPNIQSSNGYNATTSFLSCRTPYLLIERSVASFSRDYAEENGLPSNVTATLGSLSGFTTASTIKVDISGATEAENAEIAALLAGGIYL